MVASKEDLLDASMEDLMTVWVMAASASMKGLVDALMEDFSQT